MFRTEGKELNFFPWLYACKKKMLLHLYNLVQDHMYFDN